MPLRQPLVIHQAEAEHDEEADDTQRPADADAGEQEPETDEEAERSDDDPATLVGAQVGAAQGRGELGVLGVEGALHLLEQSLLVLGERHGSSFASSIGPVPVLYSISRHRRTRKPT